jgi:hypothetical protein
MGGAVWNRGVGGGERVKIISEREKILLFLKKKKQKDFCFWGCCSGRTLTTAVVMWPDGSGLEALRET